MCAIASIVAPSRDQGVLRIYRAVTVCASVVAIGASATAAQSRDLVKHPYTPYRVLSLDRVTLAADSSGLWREARDFVARLTARRLIARYVGAGTDSSPNLANVASIAFDARQRLYLLDERTPQVVILDSTARVLRSVTASGSGSNVLSHPRAIAAASNGDFFVADLHLRVSHWKHNDNTWALAGVTARFTGDPRGLCVIGSDLFAHLLPFEDSATLYRLTANGVGPGFGIVYRSPSDRANYSAREGSLVCVRDTNRRPLLIWSSSALLGEIRAFTPDGAQRWVALLPDHVPPDFWASESASRTTFPAGGADRLEALVTFGSWLLIQTSRPTPDELRSGRPAAALRSYLVDSTTGRGGRLSASLPLIKGASGSRLAVVEPGWPTAITLYRY